MSRSTVIRAINVARKVGLLKRIKKGGKKKGRGVSNRYVFAIDTVSGVTLCQPTNIVSGEATTQCQASSRHSVSGDTLSSKDHFNDLLREREDEAICLENKRGVGERREPAERPETSIAQPKSSKPKFEMDLFRAEMAARGMEMAASKYSQSRGDRTEPVSRQIENDPPLTGLLEWSTPVLTEMPYTPELRRFYCEAVEEVASSPTLSLAEIRQTLGYRQ